MTHREFPKMEQRFSEMTAATLISVAQMLCSAHSQPHNLNMALTPTRDHEG